MKQIISKPTTILVLFLFLISACRKNDLPKPTPIPGGGNNPGPVFKGQVQFQLNADLTGQPYHSSNLQAVAKFVNEKNEESEKTLLLNLPAPVSSFIMELPVGQYKLKSFRLVYGGVNTHFVAPKAGSPKASLVQKPLALDFKVEKDALVQVPVEVLRIQPNEKPADYGYASGDFDNGQSDAYPNLKLKLRTVIKVGEVIYDSIPASLVITTFSQNGEMNTSYSSLKPGVSEVEVPKAALKYTFRITKWGLTDEITINRSEADENTVYIVGGSQAAKKLKSEITSRLVNGSYLGESKKQYFYDASGKLSKIEYWLKRPDFSNFLSETEDFEYVAGKVSKIRRTDNVNNVSLGQTVFGYDNAGKLSSMSQTGQGQETHATVEHYLATQQVSIHFTYPGLTYDRNYFMSFDRGNLIMSSSNTSHHDSELARFEYDLNINPYIHIEKPDLFLSNSSKNNITWQSKEYQGSYPVAEPYNFSYTYDAEGYPKEVVKKFRTYLTGQHSYTTRTSFVY